MRRFSPPPFPPSLEEIANDYGNPDEPLGLILVPGWNDFSGGESGEGDESQKGDGDGEFGDADFGVEEFGDEFDGEEFGDGELADNDPNHPLGEVTVPGWDHYVYDNEFGNNDFGVDENSMDCEEDSPEPSEAGVDIEYDDSVDSFYDEVLSEPETEEDCDEDPLDDDYEDSEDYTGQEEEEREKGVLSPPATPVCTVVQSVHFCTVCV